MDMIALKVWLKLQTHNISLSNDISGNDFYYKYNQNKRLQISKSFNI